MSAKKKFDPIDPLAATELLGFQTHRRGARKPWTRQEDEVLMLLMAQESPHAHQVDPDSVQWDVLAEKLSPDGLRKPKDLRKRWCNSLDPGLKRGRWTKDEDDMLIAAHRAHDANWQRVAKDIPGRTDDQCAKRYLEVLDPQTKDRLRPWSRDEDLRLIRQVKDHGTKWRTVCLELKGRPSLTCRNRWRKIVTDVVRGTADAYVEEEVRAITSGEKGGRQNADAEGLEPMELGPPTGSASVSTAGDTSDRHSHPHAHQNHHSIHRHTHPHAHNQPGSRPPAPLGSKPASSGVEWRYSLGAKVPGDDTNLPHRQLFDDENGGVIRNEQLVQALIAYAKHHSLEITVHQHIHHHYSAPAPEPAPSVAGLNILSQISPQPFDALLLSPMAAPMERNYDQEVKRHGHFNYLPPLTEVPRLGSSGVFSRASPEPRDSLSPLARAVEMASVQDERKRPLASHADASRHKRHKYEASDEEELEDAEEGPDFWETMRNLTEIQQRQVSQEPVSAHHPLHYQNSSTPQPVPQLNYPVMTQAHRAYDDDDDLDMLHERRDGTATSLDPSMYDTIVQYGVLPFNPS